ncbi:MAG TPA: PRC-barrel domain containing protein [Sphingomonas sp.]|nr:PRC-barrel domain containing protein [Sphingomonas sp.]
MEDTAGWVALAATCVAAVMTASNLGPRVTGWGFVVFTIGAVAWIVVGAATGQTQLLWSNIFLGAVDLFGIWRWLGRRARFEDAAKAAQAVSRSRPGDDLFSVSAIDGMPVKAPDGSTVAHAVDALTGCGGGRIDFLIVRQGGIGGVGETLRQLPWSDVTMRTAAIETHHDAASLAALPVVEPARM